MVSSGMLKRMHIIDNVLWLTASSTISMFLPIFITICYPQLWPNKCNLYAMHIFHSFGPRFIAHISFPWRLKIAFRYKCVPYLTQSVYSSLVDRAHLWTFFCDPLHTLWYSGFTRPKVLYIEQFSLSPRKQPTHKSRRSERMQGVAKKSCFWRLYYSHQQD